MPPLSDWSASFLLLVLFLSLDWKHWRRSLVAAIPALVLIFAVELAPASFLTTFSALGGQDVVGWSDALSVGNNGRLTMVDLF